MYQFWIDTAAVQWKVHMVKSFIKETEHQQTDWTRSPPDALLNNLLLDMYAVRRCCAAFDILKY